MPLLLHITPRELVGRVVAVLEPVTMLASVISLVLVGYLVSTVLHDFHATALSFTFGPVDMVFASVGILSLIRGVYAMLSLRGHGQG